MLMKELRFLQGQQIRNVVLKQTEKKRNIHSEQDIEPLLRTFPEIVY